MTVNKIESGWNRLCRLETCDSFVINQFYYAKNVANSSNKVRKMSQNDLKMTVLRNCFPKVLKSALWVENSMFGVTALTGYVVGYMSSFSALLFFELVIATIGIIATCTWIGLGVLIQKFYLRHFRILKKGTEWSHTYLV